MVYVCKTKCYWRNKLWYEGEWVEATEADEVPRHFVKYTEIDDSKLMDGRVEINQSLITDFREVILLKEQCRANNIPYEKDWDRKQLEKALGVDMDDDPISRDINRKKRMVELKNQLVEKSIEFDLRWGPEKLQQLLDGKEIKVKPRRKKYGASGKKRKATHRKSKKTVGGRNSVSGKGQEAPQAVDGQGGSEAGISPV